MNLQRYDPIVWEVMSELEVCQGCGIIYLLSKLNDVGICKKCDDPWQLGFAAAEARIIKLLEERHRPIQNACNNLRCKIKIHTDCPTCLDEYPCIVAEEIALIKGENK